MKLRTDKLLVSCYALHGDMCSLAPNCKALGCASGFDSTDLVLVAKFAYFQEAIDYCLDGQKRGVTMRLISRIGPTPYVSEYRKGEQGPHHEPALAQPHPTLDATLQREYLRMRKSGFIARIALDYAKTRIEWRAREWDEHEREPESGTVRLRVVADDSADLDDLKGDCFNPKVNDNVSRSQLARQELAFEEQVNRDGVWGIIGEVWTGETWEHADSCFGFVGDGWRESGYDLDIMRATLDAATSYR